MYSHGKNKSYVQVLNFLDQGETNMFSAPSPSIFSSLPTNNTKPTLCGKLKSNSPGKQVYMCTVPKSGTNLLKKILGIMGLNPTAYLNKYYHLGHIKKGANLSQIFHSGEKVVIVYRDPRDIVCSRVNGLNKYFENTPHASKNSPFVGDYQWMDLTPEERITYTIKGYGDKRWNKIEIPSLQHAVKLKKEKFKNVLMLKFEDLIGFAHGGSSEEIQFKKFARLYRFFVPNSSKKEVSNTVEKCLKNYWGNTQTFTDTHKKVGQWKQHFTDEHIQLSKKFLNKYILGLGYEENANWDLNYLSSKKPPQPVTP